MPKDSPAAAIERSLEALASDITTQARAKGQRANRLFAHQWVQLTAAIDALRSLLEDSYVDWRGITSEVRSALSRATDDPMALVGLARRVALLPPLPFLKIVREARIDKKVYRYVMRVAPDGRPSFLLGSGTVRHLPIVDDTVTNPTYCSEIIAAYEHRIAEAAREHGASYLIFIDKNFGPVGTLAIISSLVQRLKLPAMIYRERKWSKNADFTGYIPESGERGLIVYDIVNTGAAIAHAVERIKEQFPLSSVPAAVVLYNISGAANLLALPDGSIVQLYFIDQAEPSEQVEPAGEEPKSDLSADLVARGVHRSGSDVRKASGGGKMARRKLAAGAEARDGNASKFDEIYELMETSAKSQTTQLAIKELSENARKGRSMLHRIRPKIENISHRFIIINLITGDYLTDNDERTLVTAFRRQFGSVPSFVTELEHS